MKFGRHIVSVGRKCIIAGLTVATLSPMFTSPAIADDNDEDRNAVPVVSGVRFGEILAEFDDAFFSHDRTYYRNRTIPGRIKFLIGPFPEVEMEKDGRDVNKLYREVLHRQMNAGPIIRTLDLPTPFPFSLRTLPPPVIAAPVQVVQPPAVVAPPPSDPIAVPTSPPKPIPALW
ncbi:MAG: hypothetical protein HC866_15225 [Leptolyngbyaceae cyanobacterium RU_5_1]|nr:hypothetical protein [Leptolyngbyaceae cyanobacterium RU_5_1]